MTLSKRLVEAMEENVRTSLKKSSAAEKKGDDGLFAVGLCQLIFAAVIVLTVLFVSKSGGTAAQNLKSDFSLLMSVSYGKEDVQKTWNSVKNYFSSPASLSVFKNTSENAETTVTEPQNSEKSTDSAETSQTEKSNGTKATEVTTETSTKKATEETKTSEKTNLKLSKKTDSSKKAVSQKSSDSFSKIASQKIIMPVSGPYTSYFGARTNPITGKDSFHTGLDIAAAQGTKIKAAYSGVVRKVGEDSRSGKYIYLTHENGVETLYCHCSAVLAEQGASIRQGETIALVGSTGWSTGPHLHFEFHKNGERLDPLPLLTKK